MARREYLANLQKAPKNIIIDTDPGGDDCMAILILLANNSTSSNILAISTVAGNADIDSVTENTIRILEVAKRSDIPVYKGASQGLIHVTSGNRFYGSDGFGDSKFDTPISKESIQDEHAAVMLVKRVIAMPNEITILALGPLTNIAVAIALYPNFLKMIKNLIILGGCYQGIGNIHPGSEFNFFFDPVAAHSVLSRAPVEKPIILLPIETVRNAAFPLKWRLDTLGRIKSSAMEFLNKIEEYSLKRRIDIYPAYDPACACVLINPRIVKKTIMVSINVLYTPEEL